MKYSQLVSDIINILHSLDNDFVLKFYDADGNTTLDYDEVQWCFIENKNMMFKMMTDEDPTLYIWKDNDSEGNKIKTLIQRIRELAVLNGVSVQIRLFNNLDQRKIYNLIKQDVESKKSKEDVKESYSPLEKSIYNLNNIIKNTKKPSDFYLSEALQTQNAQKLRSEMIASLSLYKKFNDKKFELVFESLLPSNIDDISVKINALKDNQPMIIKTLEENVSVINNIGKFVKESYLKGSNEDLEKPYLSINGLTRVYETTFNSDNDKLNNAYNHLVSVLGNATTGTDVLRAIRKHKICETYNVEKDQLLDFWLSKDNKIINESKGYVLKHLNGESISINEKYKLSIPVLESFLNNGGLGNDEKINQILAVNDKVLNIQDLLENHYINEKARKYISSLKKVYNESLDVLNGKSEVITESKENYSRCLHKVISIFGFKHPALNYIALEETLSNKEKYANQLYESRRDDYRLRAQLIPYVSKSLAKDIAQTIITSKVVSGHKISESINSKEDCLNMAKSLYNNIFIGNEKAVSTINTILYGIINKPSTLNENKVCFMKTLRKYIL